MTVDESFGVISDRMIGGIMLHMQLFNYFNFLGLKGYAECQKYHYYDENKHYVDLCNYYVNHHNKLIIEKKVESKNIIPEDWYMFTRFNVDPKVRQTAIKTGVDQWVKWERETKAMLEQHYQNLINLNEIAIAEKVSETIKHVDEELSHAEKKLLFLKAIEYNISDIMNEQEEVCHHFKKKIKEIELL